jgi:hypothetical protein
MLADIAMEIRRSCSVRGERILDLKRLKPKQTWLSHQGPPLSEQPPSPFERIRGIVRGTDSLRFARAQHMKKHAETIESYD